MSRRLQRRCAQISMDTKQRWKMGLSAGRTNKDNYSRVICNSVNLTQEIVFLVAILRCGSNIWEDITIRV
jgi:hypothetical protein